MTTLWLRSRTFALLVLWAGLALAAKAQMFTTLLNFNGANGATPQVLVQGIDGNLYGVTFEGGVSGACQALGVVNGCGTFFKMTADGTLTTLFNFCQQSGCTDGYVPVGITLASNGTFYGATLAGGANLQGTIFRITPSGSLTTLYSFCVLSNCADGKFPDAGLFQAVDGNWYGTTFGGGNSVCGYGCGTVFRMTPGGLLTTLYAFPSSGNPAGTLIQGRDGNLYGTATGNDGDQGLSTVFKISPSGSFTTIYQFSTPANVYDGLALGTDGNFYATSALGGSNSNGICGDASTCGSVFRMTPSGTLTTIYNFCAATNCTDGAEPIGPLVQATDGRFYGMTGTGGAFGSGGTIFSISPAGTFSSLLSFDGTDGDRPEGGFLQHTNGILYGTTSGGGASNDGTIFSLNMGLNPFVTFVRSFGKVGSTVQILGQGFTGATAVSFNGTAAAYSVKADTFITATVPSGATSGSVTVTTPGGTLTSNRHFRVNP
jgi:uncharacterized repeat protein (TIGR03803 family)